MNKTFYVRPAELFIDLLNLAREQKSLATQSK